MLTRRKLFAWGTVLGAIFGGFWGVVGSFAILTDDSPSGGASQDVAAYTFLVASILVGAVVGLAFMWVVRLFTRGD